MDHVLATVAGGAFAVVPGLAVPALLGVRGRAPFFVAAVVCAAAAIVVAFEVLSLFDALTTEGILLAQLAIAAVVGGAWLVLGRPRPGFELEPRFASVRAAAKAHPAVAVLTAVVTVAVCVEFVLAVAVVPNNWDSMTYHLSRPAYWLQQDSVGYFDGGHVRQLANPPVAEMLQGWTLALANSDRLAQLVQWLSLITLMAAIFSGSRMLGFGRAPSLFAAGLFAALPQPVMQATSTQNDLVVSAFLAGAVLFGARGIRDGHRGDLVVAALSLGLAVGTKGTALVAGPSLVLLLAVALWRLRPSRRLIATGAVYAVAAVAALGSFNYVLNEIHADSPLGGVDKTLKRTSPVPANLVRLSWSFYDLPGASLPWLDTFVRRSARLVFGDLQRPRDFQYDATTAVQEDRAAFGPVGFLIFVPLLLVMALAPRSPAAGRALALAGLAYLVTLSITTEDSPFQGRLLVPMVAIGAPLLALLATRPALRTVALAIALLGLVPSLLTNQNKPILVAEHTPSIFAMDRTDQQTIIRPEMREVLAGLQARVGPDQPLGFTGDPESWDYPLFGPDLDRRVVPIPLAELSRERIRRARVAGVLIADVPPPPELKATALAPRYWLVQPGPKTTSPPGHPGDGASKRRDYSVAAESDEARFETRP